MNRLRRLLRPFATILSIIAALMFVAASHQWLPTLSGGGGFALIAAIITLVIFVHELGHALAYRWLGGAVDEFAVLFIAWRRDRPGRRGGFGWARWMGGDVGGYVVGRFGATIPTWRKRIIVAAAGPLANVMLMALCLAASFALSFAMPTIWPDHVLAIAGDLPPGATPANLPDTATVAAVMAQVDHLQNLAFAQGVILLIALNSATVGFINLIPFTGSDGAAILHQWLNRPSRRRRAA